MKEGESITTEFNSALATLMRIDELLKDCSYYSREAMNNGIHPNVLQFWKNTVKSLENEIDIKMLKKERENIRMLYKRYKECGLISIPKRTEEGIIYEINPKAFNMHWNLTRKIEQYLRRIADKRGMLLPNKQGGLAIMEMD